MLFAPVEEGAFAFALVLVAALLKVFELNPVLTLLLVLALLMVLTLLLVLALLLVLTWVVEGPTGATGATVAPLELRQVAAPVESRPQVVPATQQKFSPGHSVDVGSAHPG